MKKTSAAFDDDDIFAPQYDGEVEEVQELISEECRKDHPTTITKEKKNVCNVALLITGVCILCLTMMVNYLHHTVEIEKKQPKLLTSSSSPPPPNICFVHVGKAGGESIQKTIKLLIQQGSVGGGIEVHSRRDVPEHDKDFAWNSSDGSYVVGEPGEFSDFATTVRHWRRYGAPLSNTTMKSHRLCPQTGNVVTWIRDPVSRLISVWNFFFDPDHLHHQQKRIVELNEKYQGDLNTLIDQMRTEEMTYQTGYQHLFEIFYEVSHATSDISFFFGNSQKHAETWEERSTSCNAVLDSLPMLFIGRTEHMVSDWDAFLDLLPNGSPRVPLIHTHSTPREGKILHEENINFLRKFYATDYDCISYMIKKGWVEETYYQYITSNEREYIY